MVSQIFDRLGYLFRSFLQDDHIDYHAGKRPFEPNEDFNDAWEELEDFLNGRTEASTHTTTTNKAHRRTVPYELKDDYATLQVEFGAPFGEVKRTYKKLLLVYHPDHHSEDPKRANEMTQKINRAFSRIKRWEESQTS